MQRVKADILVQVTGFLTFVAQLPESKDFDNPLTDKTRFILRNTLFLAENDLLVIGLPMSRKSVERGLALIDNPKTTPRQIKSFANDLNVRLQDELSYVLLFKIEPDKQEVLDTQNLFGEAVATKFPSASLDIEEVGKCLAFERWTAAVFHAMRVLQIGLNAMAKKLGIEYKDTNWNTIIDQIEAEIKKISKASSGSAWKEKEQFYSEAATQFRYFKNAWRNHIVHGRQSYDEKRTRAIFEHVKQFMTHISTGVYIEEGP